MLEFFTCEELIEELAKRQTFAGIIFKSNKELKNNTDLSNQIWEITYCNLTEEESADLLRDSVNHFENMLKEENE